MKEWWKMKALMMMKMTGVREKRRKWGRPNVRRLTKWIGRSVPCDEVATCDDRCVTLIHLVVLEVSGDERFEIPPGEDATKRNTHLKRTIGDANSLQNRDNSVVRNCVQWSHFSFHSVLLAFTLHLVRIMRGVMENNNDGYRDFNSWWAMSVGH